MKTKKQKQNNNIGVVLHGECMIFPSNLPENSKIIPPRQEGYVIVAPSETTGNHHVVDTPEGVTFYESNGIKFMVNSVPTTVRCVIKERHDAIELPPGTWEFGSQQEYDPFTARMNEVRD